MENVEVGKADITKTDHIFFRDGARVYGQFHRISEHGNALLREACRLEVRFDFPCEIVIAEQSAQTAPMMGRSVVALVDLRDHHRHHLPLYLSQRFSTPHRLAIENVMRLETPRVEGVDPHHPINALMGWINDPVSQLGEGTLPLILVGGFDPWHRTNLAVMRIAPARSPKLIDFGTKTSSKKVGTFASTPSVYSL